MVRNPIYSIYYHIKREKVANPDNAELGHRSCLATLLEKWLKQWINYQIVDNSCQFILCSSINRLNLIWTLKRWDSTSSGASETHLQHCLWASLITSQFKSLTKQYFYIETYCFRNFCVLGTSYQMSSDDIHWADHTENQQHTCDGGHYDEFCVIPHRAIPVAIFWKTHTVQRQSVPGMHHNWTAEVGW